MDSGILIGAFFILAIIGFSSAMVVIIAYLLLEQRKKNREDKEQEEASTQETPPHIKQRNFDDFIKNLIKRGMLMDTDRSYRHLRQKLQKEVDLELEGHKERKLAEAQPTLEKELEKREKNGRRQ